METSFFWFGVFSGSFGVRSIVLCKCSGNVLIGYYNLYTSLIVLVSELYARENKNVFKLILKL